MATRSTVRRGNLLDAAYQNRLAARLRSTSPDRWLSLIKALIARDPKVGLSIANRVIRQRGQLEELFIQGLENSNESTSRFWIESLGPRLGALRVIELIERHARANPAIAAKSLYWLSSLVKDDPKAKSSLRKLRDELGKP
ncbi:MAG TPA: hypothetical protein VK797_04440 [Tepidisphaeraceae bacterium]|jgi:hypothetical protein|nr:hypothetical protein [Tepidisphaeraceae bacterium]